jgi:predicted MFS family arabinose efflux permease
LTGILALTGDGNILGFQRKGEERNHPVQNLRAFKLVLLMGTISLFIDMAGDGYYSVVGPYLGTLGASAAMIAVIVGIAGLVAYTPRLASGWYCDHTGHYWDIMIVGLVINFIAVPILALAGHWELAFGVIIFDRMGRALRSPARDAIISHAAKGMGGAGRAFGLHEAMSDIGSMAGPIIVAVMLQANYGYSLAMGVLIVPAFLAIVVVFLTVHWYPKPIELEETCLPERTEKPVKARLPRLFWVYMLAVGLIAAAFIDFPLISFHMSNVDHLQTFWIPVLFAVGMGLDALSAIIIGHFFDRIGITVTAVVFAVSAFFVPLVFGTDPLFMIIGIALWGVGQGAIGSILRAAVSQLVPQNRRGLGYGIFSTAFGISWFLGSAATGVLYVISIPLMIIVSVIVQFVAVIIFLYIQRQLKKDPNLNCVA